MRRSRRVALLATAMAAAIAGCSSNTPNPGPSAPDSQVTTPTTTSASGGSTSPTTSPATSSSSAPADPRVAAAVKAYGRFIKAKNYAYMNPPKKVGDRLPRAGNFRPYSFDPEQGQTLSDILSLTELQVAYRGTPPVPRVSVVHVDLAGKPYPTVTLADCPTPANWKIVATSAGPPPTVKSSPSGAPAPNLATAKVIFYEKHWGVSTISVDTSRTCKP